MSKVNANIVNYIKQLPTLPTVYTTLTEAIANPRATSNDIAQIISSDQAASTKVLRAANSAMFGLRGRIETISQAIMHLGFNEIRNLIFAMSVINIFKKKSSSFAFNPVEFWKHSIAVGALTRFIGHSAGVINLENYFLGGVLHDVGKLLIFEFAEGEFKSAVEYAEANHLPIIEAEKQVLGINHTNIGGALAENWKLPIDIKNCILFHHKGFIDNKPDILTASCHAANIIARMLNFGSSGDDVIPAPNIEVWDYLKLEPRLFTKHYNLIIQTYEESVSLILIK